MKQAFEWQSGELHSPLSGEPLVWDSEYSLAASADNVRFPVVNGIPYLRIGKDALRSEILSALEGGDEVAALILLLGDSDDWARNAPPSPENLQKLIENQSLTLRESMRLLEYDGVTDYFAYRWSDPTYLSGLQLLETHLPASAGHVLELACGIGHYLREFEERGINATGVDVVFSKLYLARRFVAPAARLVCADANYKFPFADDYADAAFCHDAFYFLGNKPQIAAELNRVVVNTGAIIVGHVHNAEVDNYSSGAPLRVDEYAAFFDTPILYDDAELTRSFIEQREPQSQVIEELRKAAAVAIVRRPPDEYQEDDTNDISNQSFTVPTVKRSLRLNPLFERKNGELLKQPAYPSERYQAEYSALSDYLGLTDDITNDDIKAAISGNWFDNKRLLDLVRRRVFLDLPEKW